MASRMRAGAISYNLTGASHGARLESRWGELNPDHLDFHSAIAGKSGIVGPLQVR